MKGLGSETSDTVVDMWEFIQYIDTMRIRRKTKFHLKSPLLQARHGAVAVTLPMATVVSLFLSVFFDERSKGMLMMVLSILQAEGGARSWISGPYSGSTPACFSAQRRNGTHFAQGVCNMHEAKNHNSNSAFKLQAM